MTTYNTKGQEVPDRKPIALPVGYRVPETLQEMIARMVQKHSMIAERQGHESFEEADDFDVDDMEDDAQLSGHQLTQMQEEAPRFLEKEERKLEEKAVQARKAKMAANVQKQNAEKVEKESPPEELEQ